MLRGLITSQQTTVGQTGVGSGLVTNHALQASTESVPVAQVSRNQKQMARKNSDKGSIGGGVVA